MIPISIIISGFGVIGTETLYQIVKINKKKKLNISILEKDFSNFPGGIAYSKLNSKYGFFNNPLRLSNIEFKKWVKKIKNQRKLIEYFKSNRDLKLSNWVLKNVSKKTNKFNNIDELYLPRSAYAIYLEEKFLKTLKILKLKKHIKINFYENQLVKIKKDKNNKIYSCHLNEDLREKNIIVKNNNFFFKNSIKDKTKIINADSLVLGLGILPPANINHKKKFLNKNYIHDFYASGGTSSLMRKIYEKKNMKKIVIIFIGNKAGLLETMQEFENLEKLILNKVKIISISSSPLSLEKASLSNKFNLYKFKYLIKKNISKIKKSDDILNLIKKEFKNGLKNKYFKYDVWTQILKKKILEKCYKKLSLIEKKNYNNSTFKKLRNITRYTYPQTVESKNRLEKLKILKNLKDKVFKLKNIDNKISVKTKNNLNIKADIVVNVSGPVSLMDNYDEVPFLNSLKKISNNFNDRGFVSDEFNQIGNKIYAPGTLSSNFNPQRKTIIKSITENCEVTAKHLIY